MSNRDMMISTPRISAPYLEQFQHKTVRITGKVSQLRGDQATIDASGPVTLILTRDSHLKIGNGVEVIGKVDKDLSVRVLQSTDLGTDVDYSVAEAVVDATHRCHDIFYEKD